MLWILQWYCSHVYFLCSLLLIDEKFVFISLLSKGGLPWKSFDYNVFLLIQFGWISFSYSENYNSTYLMWYLNIWICVSDQNNRQLHPDFTYGCWGNVSHYSSLDHRLPLLYNMFSKICILLQTSSFKRCHQTKLQPCMWQSCFMHLHSNVFKISMPVRQWISRKPNLWMRFITR